MQSAINSFLPPLGKHFIKWLAYPDYRHISREVAKLKSLPRYQPATTDIHRRPLEMVDAASFLYMYREIFEECIYAFRAKSEKPYIIDGGANIGLSVLYFKELYPMSEIVAFEPDDMVFSVLEKNVRSNGHQDVKLICRALWKEETTLTFMSEGADGGRVARPGDQQHKTVQTTGLRDHLDRPVDFLKLDIEGAEAEVLVDCAAMLCNIENLFVEYHSFAKEPQTLHTITDLLADAGFRLHIHTPLTSPQPFLHRDVSGGMDLQLNIFAFRA